MITTIILCVPGLALTALMFLKSTYMLGFPSAIFWGIAGGYAYQHSTATWDMQYFIFFGAMGMVLLSLLAMPALRRRDTAGPDADKGGFIDEKSNQRRSSSGVNIQYADDYGDTGEEDPFDIDKLPMHGLPEGSLRSSRYSKGVRERAEKRKAKTSYGEFS